MKLLNVLTLVLAITYSGYISAEDQTNYRFEKGSVLVRCMAPTGHPQISTELFNVAFPHWIEKLQGLANDGLVSRAHYLGELKEGVFIVVVGKDKIESMSNAEVVISAINMIMKKAIVDSGVEPSFEVDDACQFIEIGPVAVLPTN